MKNNSLLFIGMLSVLIIPMIVLSNLFPASHFCEDIALCGFSEGHNQAGLFKQFSSIFTNLFATDKWPARWNCGEWSTALGWTSIVSDFVIFGSYFGIPTAIFYFHKSLKVEKAFYKDLILLFALFILACGITHIIDVIIFWKPLYNLSVFSKLITAIISGATLVMIIRNIPSLIELKSPSQLQEIIKIKTADLEVEVQRRKASEESLKKQLELNARLYKEGQHRIKNNLQLISSLIFLKTSGKETVDIDTINSISQRISSIGKINELLLLNDIINEVDAKSYITKLSEALKGMGSGVSNLNWNISVSDDIKVNSEFAVYCGLIFYEFTSNSIKYAFESIAEPVINIDLQKEGNILHFTLSDNGNGGLSETPSGSGFGVGLIENFVGYINGEHEWVSNSDGTSLSIKVNQ